VYLLSSTRNKERKKENEANHFKGWNASSFQNAPAFAKEKIPLDQLPSRYTRNFELVRYEEMSRLAGRSI
jgi:hypothetical protein